MPSTAAQLVSRHNKLTAFEAGASRNAFGILSEDRTSYRPKALLEMTRLRPTDLQKLSGIHRVSSYKTELPLKPSAKLTRRIKDLVLITDLAYELFGEDKEQTRIWLMSPNTNLFGAVPFEVCFRGDAEPLIRWLNQLLGRTESATF